MSSGARSAGNRIMLGHPYECAQLFHEIGPIGLFIKYKTSFTFRDEDDDDDDTILTSHTYAKLLHLPDGHIPSIAELSPVFAALNILHAWSPEDRSYYLCRGLRWSDTKSRSFSFFLHGSLMTQEVTICFMPKTKEQQWYLCVLVDTVNGGKIQGVFEACDIKTERRRIHIEHDIHAFF